MLFLNEWHLMRVLREYRDFYNHERYHQGIIRISDPAKDIDDNWNFDGKGKSLAKLILNGLHHSYRLAA